jgi:hypothetical protein
LETAQLILQLDDAALELRSRRLNLRRGLPAARRSAGESDGLRRQDDDWVSSALRARAVAKECGVDRLVCPVGGAFDQVTAVQPEAPAH